MVYNGALSANTMNERYIRCGELESLEVKATDKCSHRHDDGTCSHDRPVLTDVFDDALSHSTAVHNGHVTVFIASAQVMSSRRQCIVVNLREKCGIDKGRSLSS